MLSPKFRARVICGQRYRAGLVWSLVAPIGPRKSAKFVDDFKAVLLIPNWLMANFRLKNFYFFWGLGSKGQG